MPPKGFKLVWTLVGERNTGGGVRTLYRARSTPLLSAARSAGCWKRLYALGFGNDQHLEGAVLFWMRPDFDAAAAAVEILAITRETRAYRNRTREARRAAADRRVHEAQERAVRRISAQEGLRRILAERSWAIHHSFIERAVALSKHVELDDAVVPEVEKIVRNTDATVARAEAKLKLPPPAELRAMCETSEVRSAVKVALRAITGNDEDWASVKNDVGWSKATTVAGHVLAAQEDLSADLAAHAMKLLYIHHTQVPIEVRPILGIH